MNHLYFKIIGKAATQGSKTARMSKCRTFAFVYDANPFLKAWRKQCTEAAEKHYMGPVLTCPITLSLAFVIERPAYHFGTGKNAGQLKEQYKDAAHLSKPDCTKLQRAVEDSMSGVVWKDDSQVIHITTSKRYCKVGEKHHVEVNIFWT